MRRMFDATDRNTPASKLFAMILIGLFLHVSVWAEPKTPAEAMRMVRGWLCFRANPLQEDMGRDITNVESYLGEEGEPLYHVACLEPSGFVIASADDEIEPVIAFADEGIYEFSEKNPLFALVTQDLQERSKHAIRRRTKEPLYSTNQGSDYQKENQSKWKKLESHMPVLLYNSDGQDPLSMVSSIWVAPLLETQWDQRTARGNACFNYFTPQSRGEQIIFTSGDPNNYPCGCVATAIAQLLKYHQYPTGALTQSEYPITVVQNDGIKKQNALVTLLGGDLQGGGYQWDLMPAIVTDNTTEDQRQAIGALCADTGAAVHTQYSPFESSASIGSIARALKSTFLYQNAILGIHLNSGYLHELSPDLESMINPNLDAGYPVILCVYEVFESHRRSGHAIVADGYGYNLSTRYYHLNMGWGGNADVWYNLPMVNHFNFIAGCVYNVFPEKQGEIISGRITNTMGDPIDDVLVTLKYNENTAMTTTNENGIYAFAGLLPNTNYRISASKPGYTFTPEQNLVPTAASISCKIDCGNIWGIDFKHNDLN